MRSQNKTVQNEHVILRRVSRIQVIDNDTQNSKNFLIVTGQTIKIVIIITCI